MARKTNFKWRWKNQYGSGLTKRAKAYLSEKATSRYRRERIIVAQQDVPAPIGSRIRTQKVLNAESAGANIGISLRAMGIERNEEELDAAIDEFMNSNEWLLQMPFETSGFERERITKDEDRILRKDKITIELNVRGQVTYTEL